MITPNIMNLAHLDKILPIILSLWDGTLPLHLHLDLALPEGDATICRPRLLCQFALPRAFFQTHLCFHCGGAGKWRDET